MTDKKNIKYYDNLAVASSPHLVTALDTQKTMMWVLIALIPSFIASVFYFGLGAVILTAVCAVSSALFEWGYERLLGKKVTVKDLSACVTGVILAMNLPANLPVWMAVIGCFTAIVIVKQLYGGLGRNFANPAIVGRIVLLLSFTSYMTTWPVTRLNHTADALTGATPLGLLANGALAQAPSLKGRDLHDRSADRPYYTDREEDHLPDHSGLLHGNCVCFRFHLLLSCGRRLQRASHGSFPPAGRRRSIRRDILRD